MCLISRRDVAGRHGETALECTKSRIGLLGDELVHSLGVDELEADTLRAFEEGTAPAQWRESPSGAGAPPPRRHPDDDGVHETHAVRLAEGDQRIRQEQWGRK